MSSNNIVAGDAINENDAGPNCSIPDRWYRRLFYQKYRTDTRKRYMNAPCNETNIIPRPDRRRHVKIGVTNRSCSGLFCVYGCFSFPAYRLKVYFQGYARYLDCVGHGLPQLDTTKPRTVHSDSRPFICIYKCGNSARINSNNYSSEIFVTSKVTTLINFAKFWPNIFEYL